MLVLKLSGIQSILILIGTLIVTQTMKFIKTSISLESC